MNRFVAIQGCIAVLLLGPFTHVHHSVGHDGHAVGEETTIVHSHVSFDAAETTESSKTTVVRPRSSATNQISIFDFQKVHAAQQPLLLAFVLHVPALVVRDFQSNAPDPVAHAPPQFACFGLRSPPA